MPSTIHAPRYKSDYVVPRKQYEQLSGSMQTKASVNESTKLSFEKIEKNIAVLRPYI